MQAQAPICPYCNDDHSSLTQCDPRELKKVVLKTKFDKLMEILEPKSEKFRPEGIDTFKRMIDWL